MLNDNANVYVRHPSVKLAAIDVANRDSEILSGEVTASDIVALHRDDIKKSQGIIVDIHFSDVLMSSFKEKVRSSSIVGVGLDPKDIDFSGIGDANNSSLLLRWADWRVSRITKLLTDISTETRKILPSAKIYAFGDASYYSDIRSHSLRQSADWKKWIENKIVDGVLVRGRWTGNYNDTQTFAQTYISLFPVGSIHNYEVIPVSGGKNVVKDSTYSRDWATLQARLPDLDVLVCGVRNADDAQAVQDLKDGNAILSTINRPQVGALAPADSLLQENNQVFDVDQNFPQNALALLLVPRATMLSDSARTAIPGIADQLMKKNIVLRYIEQGVGRGNGGDWRLRDSNRDLLAHFPTALTLLQADNTGFLRSIENIDNKSLIAKISSIKIDKPLLEVGRPAPDFILPDMNGELRHLSDLKGKKSLLLTFFPKCFTGGCTNHLSSLRDKKADFDSANTEVWAVSVDPGDVQIAFSIQWRFNFPLIPDTGRNLCLLYGAAQNTEQLAERMSVFIDKNGIVKWIDKDVHVTTHGADVLARIKQ